MFTSQCLPGGGGGGGGGYICGQLSQCLSRPVSHFSAKKCKPDISVRKTPPPSSAGFYLFGGEGLNIKYAVADLGGGGGRNSPSALEFINIAIAD